MQRYEDAGVTTLAVSVGGGMTREQAVQTLGVLAQVRAPSPRSG